MTTDVARQPPGPEELVWRQGWLDAFDCDMPSTVPYPRVPLYTLLDNKYYFDRFNDWFFAGGARKVGAFLSNVGDRSIIDGFFVNGTAKVVGWTAALMRHIQSGYVYHYAFTMILGVFALLTWWTR